jgi:hypothetical protein
MIVDLEKIRELIKINKTFSNAAEIDKLNEAVDVIEFVATKLDRNETQVNIHENCFFTDFPLKGA